MVKVAPDLLRLRSVFEDAAIGMATADRTGRFVLANQAYLDLVGYTEEELTSKDYASITHSGDVGVNLLLAERMYGGEIPHAIYEKRYVRRDGDIRWVRNSVSLVRDSLGNAVNVIALTEDITNAKHAEKEIRRKNQAIQKLSERISRLQNEERARLARDLHDSTAQLLTALSMSLSVVVNEAHGLNDRVQRALAESVSLADQSLRQIRTAAYLLHPIEPAEVGFERALLQYVDGFVQRSGIVVNLDLSLGRGELPPEVEAVLFRIVQESLTNVYRHSGSDRAILHILRRPSQIALEVKDRGRGIPGTSSTGGGITGMRERVRQLGGSLSVQSSGAVRL